MHDMACFTKTFLVLIPVQSVCPFYLSRDSIASPIVGSMSSCSGSFFVEVRLTLCIAQSSACSVYKWNSLPNLIFSMKMNNDVKHIRDFGFINNPHAISIVSENKNNLDWHITYT